MRAAGDERAGAQCRDAQIVQSAGTQVRASIVEGNRSSGDAAAAAYRGAESKQAATLRRILRRAHGGRAAVEDDL